MEKSYNLSMLFEEDEFDAQKGYKRYGTKEAYFSALHRFTLDSQTIMDKCNPERYNSGSIDIYAFRRYVERLQRMLASIGAINLAWSIQNLNHLIEEKQYKEYVEGIGEVFPNVNKLCERITSAEKVEGASERVAVQHEAPSKAEAATDATRRRIKPRRGDFEKLLMLVDNFELESALETAGSIMRYSYTPTIDETLNEVCRSLNDFNYGKAMEDARTLLGFAIYSDETNKPVKKSILAIDDMPDVLRTVKAMLKDRYNVFGVTDYAAAVKFLRSNTADLIMLDIEMPGLDGFSMMQLFRKLPEYADTPIVFLTSNVSEKYINKAMSLGASDFIKKPVNLAVLVDKLENALLRD